LNNIEDQIGFVAELLDKYIFSASMSESEQVQIVHFLQGQFSFKINGLLDEMTAYFQCKPLGKEEPSVETARKTMQSFQPSSV
jgi:hypothetical protein